MNHFLILIPQSLNSQFLNLAPIAIIMRIVSKKRTWFLDQITMSELRIMSPELPHLILWPTSGLKYEPIPN